MPLNGEFTSTGVATSNQAHDSQLETLKAVYERTCQERDRIRDARGYFARGLGPAPASAGIATALVAAIGNSNNALALAVAVVLVGLMILVSSVYDGKPAYRHLYAKRLAESRADVLPPDELRPEQWYREMIELERDIYGWPPRRRNHYFWPGKQVNDLQQALDCERTGRIVVAVLWVGVVVALVFAAPS